MKTILKSIIITVLFVFSQQIVFSQEDKTVTLVVSGQGATQDEARQKALRGAIEQAFGTFISSKTEILNDNLVKDEIVSVANGNIQKFDVVNETLLPNNVYVSTLNATVSLLKLTTFCQSKGINSEFKGGLFATNILMQELYEKNEFIALKNIIEILKNVANNSFDYNILTKDPISNNGNWNIPLQINVVANKNFLQIPSFLSNTITNISLSTDEVANYSKLNKPTFPITFASIDNKGIYYLRNQNSIQLIIDFVYSLSQSIVNFEIDNGVEKFDLEKYNTSSYYRADETVNLGLDDRNFRIILKNWNDGGSCGVCAPSLFNNSCGSRHDSEKPNFDYKKVYTQSYDGNYLNKYSIEYGPSKEQSCDIFSRENFKSFISLKKLMLSSFKSGLVISFATIREGSPLMHFFFNDVRNIEEIKKITEFKVVKF
jgi:hypothetical protein